MFTEIKGWTAVASSDPSSAPFSCLNVHLGFTRDDTKALYYLYPNILDWSPPHTPAFVTSFCEWTCTCLPFQASHTHIQYSTCQKCRFHSCPDYKGNSPIRSRDNEGMQSFPMSQKLSSSTIPLIFFFFFLKCLSWYFCIKVTRLSLGTLLCVCGLYSRWRVTTCVCMYGCMCACLCVCVPSALL